MLNRLARAALDKFGLNISRKPDDFRLSVYEAMYPKEVLARKPFINIGAGSFWHPYWTNVDYVSKWYAGVQKDIVPYDIMAKQPLPFADNSIKIAYTSHTIEHVKDDAVAALFREVHRVLEPGGIFRVTTGPDADTDYRALMNNDADWFYWDDWYSTPDQYGHMCLRPPASAPLPERWLHHVASALAPNANAPGKKYDAKEIMDILRSKTKEEALDFFTSQCPFDPERPGHHVSWWNNDKGIRYLRDAGFATVYRSGHRQSVSPLLRLSNLFDSTHPPMSIYVEAIKGQ